MRKSDITWVESLARHACGKPRRNAEGPQVVLGVVQVFSDELCGLMNEYCSYFNELVRDAHPDALVRVFRLANNRAGLMLLRGRDKLVISAEPPLIRARIVQVFAYGERSLEELAFEAQVDSSGEIVWVSTADGQRVNPELVARYYLSPFLASGASAYVMPGVENRHPADALHR